MQQHTKCTFCGTCHCGQCPGEKKDCYRRVSPEKREEYTKAQGLL